MRGLMKTKTSLRASSLLFAIIGALVFACNAGEAGGAEAKEGPGVIDKQPLKVTSESMHVKPGKRSVRFEGDVVAEGDFRMCSDELRILYTESGAIKVLVAKGNVILVSEERTISGELAKYDPVGRSFTMSGNVHSFQCGDKISSDKVTFYLDRDDVVIESREGGRVSAVIMPEKVCEEVVSDEELRCRRAR